MYSRYVGFKDNRPPFYRECCVCTWYRFWHHAVSRCFMRRDAICCLTITEAFPSEREPRVCRGWELRRSVLSSNTWKWMTKECEACIELWMTPWCHSVLMWEGIWKEKRHQHGIVYNTSERARLRDWEKKPSGIVSSLAARILSGDLSINNIMHTLMGSHLTKDVSLGFWLRYHAHP